ncbi:kinase-like domain-containing protein [Massariosphaeria phaeospora]|uniref:Altered inheritance of mitochondria protein 9, mitochondrial n=1 Tax=Massariosphaeria phaeospora TaxID=100035 RepID=A0A7C8MJY2_9PLEO|nr:kinase-like domain-containing protein [Massariosphaeria phaeospora]
MPFGLSLRAVGRRYWKAKGRFVSAQPSRALSITCRGKSISREEVFRYTNGRFLMDENHAFLRRYVKFDLDQLCAVAASAGGQNSPVNAIEKMEGGFSKALLLRKEDGSEIIAKIPFPIAGPPKYTTAAEVAVLQYLHAHTQIPVPKVLAWSSDPSNPVGAEYIIMEKASGIQLFKRWGEMTDYDQFCLVKQLTRLEGELAALRFPASGSLYPCESMGQNDTYVTLDRETDPSGRFCIGPSCERGWDIQAKTVSSHSQLDQGPWPSLSSFGIALAERELARIEQNPTTAMSDPPRGSFEEQIAVLKMARDVMLRLDSDTLIDKVSQPVLWHTDLHMGNIYVSDEDVTKIVSIIDWQSIVISPLFLQARFPEFLSVDEDYALGTEIPKLPKDYDQMDEEDKKLADYKLQEAKMAKTYELSSGSQNKQAYKALFIPSFLRELFTRCGEASEEGIVPLRACLIELSTEWAEIGFTGQCPFIFSDEDIRKHDQEFEKYRDFHKIQELARKLLDTDSEGWIAPQLDFSLKQQQNEELLRDVMRRSHEYNKSPEEVQRIWPFLDRSKTKTHSQ